MLAAGTRLGPYTIIVPLGAGGMGEVYRARDARLDRDVAVKVLPERLTHDPAAVDRFIREARAASALNHPNIVTIHEIGETDAGRFIVMELILGQTLRALIGRRFTLEAFVDLGVQIARALAVAHAAGIIHRDIKPENVMMRDDGYVKVLDFGLARLLPTRANAGRSDVETVAATTPGVRLGTVRYMSPEQVRAETMTAATDIFSLGIVFYELATGQPPFTADSQIGVLQAILSEPPQPPSRLNPEIPKPLEALMLQMLAKDARLRPSASEVDAALAELLGKRTGLQPRRVALDTKRHSVGREKERAELRAGLDWAAAGHGLLMCVSGEPGIGKTTLVEDFLSDLVADGHACRIARGRCSERLAGTEAYLPWLEALESLLHGEGGESVARLMKLVAPTWYHWVAPLAPDDPSSAGTAADAPGVSQERLKRELGAFLQDVSRLRPLVLFVDDVHWADVSTIDLLAYLTSKFEALPVLIVATYRPSELLLAQHPFVHVKLALQARGVCREMPLGFLTIDHIDRYLALEFPEHRFPEELPTLIHAKTEGNPLFMADLVRHLRDRHVISEERERWVLAQSVPDLQRELPESVRSMIQTKLAQLSEADHRLLVAASVQGYEFDSAVVSKALVADAAEVEERLDALERVHFFVRLVNEQELPDRTLTLRYRFVHVLYQNALYASLRPTRRASLSVAVAEALLGYFGKQYPAIASELALLFEAARESARAAEYFLLAAQHAAGISANREAVLLARRGIEALKTLPETRERAERELLLQTTLGPALMSTTGWGTPEVGAIYARAQELCRHVGETPQLFPVIWGLYQFFVARGQYQTSGELGEQLLALAQKAQDAALLLEAHNSLANTLWLRGEWEPARAHAEQAIAIYVPREHHSLAFLYGGHDPGVACRVFAALSLWSLGYPDQALLRSHEAIALAREISHTYSMVFALVFQAMVHQRRREAQLIHERVEAALPLASQLELAPWLAWATALRGWALAEQGQADEGIAQLRQGIAGWKAPVGSSLLPYFLALLAEAYATVGQAEEGLTTLAEALAITEQSREGYMEAELYRLKGEFLLEPAEKEACFHQAIEIARRQKAKSFELRAVMSLSRLYDKQGKCTTARQLLTDIYGWFTEGFDTADLKEAAALLERFGIELRG